MFNGKVLLTSLIAVSLTVANLTASKLAQVPIIDAAIPAGFIGIAVAFLATDLLSERYGKEAARNAVNGAVFALIVGWVLVYASLLMPTSPFYAHGEAFEIVMGQSAHIVLASIVTLGISQNVDVTLFHKIKSRFERKFMRNIGSTVISQFVDTTVFIGLGFVLLPALFGGSVTPLVVAGELIVTQYVVKVVIAVLDTPLFYALTE